MKTVKTDLICSECGTVNTINRKSSLQKKEYHIKNLYCYCCKQVTKQIEVFDSSLFEKKLEFEEQLTDQEQQVLTLLKNTKRIKI